MKIGVISDTHCGSHAGLLHPDRWNKHTPGAIKWLHGCFDWLYSEWPKLDLLILNGDIIDGKQSKSAGTGVHTASLGEQVEIALECFRPWRKKAAKIIRLAGTPYHEGFDGALREFDSEMGIARPKSVEQWIVRDIDIGDGVTLNVKHHPDGGHAIYRGTVMDRELLWRTVAESVHKLPNASIVLRSHLHTCAAFAGFRKELHLCPCFQLQSPYALHKQHARWIPDIGGTLIESDRFAMNKFSVRHKVFPMPREKAERYEAI